MLSLIALIIFHLVTYSWPFIPGHIEMHNSTTVAHDKVGCNTDKFSWCEDLSPVNVYLYYAAYIIVIGFAFPIMNITTTTLFSKILGPRRQGTQQGIFQVSGGVARMIGPIAISILYTEYGPRMAWNMEIIVIGVTLLGWCAFYRRMIPLQIPASGIAATSIPAAVIAPPSSGGGGGCSKAKVAPVKPRTMSSTSTEGILELGK